MLTLTFAAARREHACQPGYDEFAAHKGGDAEWGMDRPIPLLEVLDLLGLDDALWALHCCEPAAERDKVPQMLAADYAEHVLPLYEQQHPGDDRPRRAIKVSRRCVAGEATAAELYAARRAARAAAAAAWDAARTAARAAAYAAQAAADAAYAARDAAHAAQAAAYATGPAWAAAAYAAYAAEYDWQAARLRQYLTGEAQSC